MHTDILLTLHSTSERPRFGLIPQQHCLYQLHTSQSHNSLQQTQEKISTRWKIKQEKGGILILKCVLIKENIYNSNVINNVSYVFFYCIGVLHYNTLMKTLSMMSIIQSACKVLHIGSEKNHKCPTPGDSTSRHNLTVSEQTGVSFA